jgi:LacI family transcriptional regulator
LYATSVQECSSVTYKSNHVSSIQCISEVSCPPPSHRPNCNERRVRRYEIKEKSGYGAATENEWKKRIHAGNEKEQGYELSFIKTGAELEDRKTLYNTFSTPISGLILMESLNTETYHFIRNQVPNIIGVDTQWEDIDNVGYDHYRVAAMAVQHLISRGHRDIGYIGGSGSSNNIKTSQRYRGYYSSLHAAGLQVNPDWVIDCAWDENICMEKISQLCRKGNSYPTAFFVASDLMAMAALSGLYNLGISVPNEVAVIGLSNIEISKYSNPPLTTIEIPTREIGMVAVDLLISRLNGYQLLPRKVILPTSLILRNST